MSGRPRSPAEDWLDGVTSGVEVEVPIPAGADRPSGRSFPSGRSQATMRRSGTAAQMQKAVSGIFGTPPAPEPDEELEKQESELMQRLRASANLPDPDAPPAVSITWKDVSFSVLQRGPAGAAPLTILEPSSGDIPGGTLCAFMGPSGSGKSTLMDIIAKKKTAKHEGAVFANGHAVGEEYPLMLAYVGQEDLMHQHCTVEEVLAFTAKMKRPKGAGFDIDEVLDDFGLLHVKATRIGGPAVRGISGGQRRRVSLARGVVSNAQIMFLDEPTTGLSSTDAELCVRVLKKMTEKYAITILVVIHQPRVEVARLFDQLILLCARPGRIVYDGSMSDAVGYFAGVGHPVPRGSNFADHILDVVTPGAPGADPDAFADWYQEKLLPGTTQKVDMKLAMPMSLTSMSSKSTSREGPPTLGLCSQFRIVFGREVSLLRNDKRVILSSIIVSWVKSVLLGLMFQGVGKQTFMAQLSFIYVLMLTISLGSLEQIARLMEIRDIMKLEVDQRLYRIGVWMVASSIVQITLAALGSSVFLITMFLFSGMAGNTFLPIFGWSSMLFMVFISFTGLIAAAAKSQPQAQAIAMPGILLMVMVSGFYISKQSAPVYLYWMLYVSPIALAMELLANDLFKDTDAYAVVQATYGYDEDASPAVFIFVCVGLTLVFRVGQCLCLVFMHKIQR